MILSEMLLGLCKVEVHGKSGVIVIYFFSYFVGKNKYKKNYTFNNITSVRRVTHVMVL